MNLFNHHIGKCRKKELNKIYPDFEIHVIICFIKKNRPETIMMASIMIEKALLKKFIIIIKKYDEHFNQLEWMMMFEKKQKSKTRKLFDSNINRLFFVIKSKRIFEIFEKKFSQMLEFFSADDFKRKNNDKCHFKAKQKS